jgi:hypothetical protein
MEVPTEYLFCWQEWLIFLEKVLTEYLLCWQLFLVDFYFIDFKIYI